MIPHPALPGRLTCESHPNLTWPHTRDQLASSVGSPCSAPLAVPLRPYPTRPRCSGLAQTNRESLTASSPPAARRNCSTAPGEVAPQLPAAPAALQPGSLPVASPSASSRLLSITLLVLARSSQKDPCSPEVLGCGSCFSSVLCKGVLRPPEPRAPSSWHPALAAGCGSCPDVSFLKRATQMLLAKHSGGPRWKVCLHFQLGFCHLIANTAWSSMCLGSFSSLFER